MAPLSKEEMERFVRDMCFVHESNENVSLNDQLTKKEELKPFFDKSIREKIEYLDELSDDQKIALSMVGKNLKEWIYAPDVIVSVDIRSETKTTRKNPFERETKKEKKPEEKPGKKREETPSASQTGTPSSQTRPSSSLSATPSNQTRPSSSQSGTSSSQPKPRKSIGGRSDNTKIRPRPHSNITPSANLGEIREQAESRRESLAPTTPAPETPKRKIDAGGQEPEQEDEEPSWKKVSEGNGEIELNDPGRRELEYRANIGRMTNVTDEKTKTVRKVFQNVHFTFAEDDDGYTHLKKWIDVEKEVDRDASWPTKKNPEISRLNARGVIHETALFLSKFIESHQNFTEHLHIEVDLWSHKFEFPLFRHVKKFTIRHNSFTTTQWWMKQVRTNRTIPEITILRNYDGSHPSEATFREEQPFQNHEALPYVIPFEGREVPGWVEVVPYCEHAIFYANKLTIEPVVGMSLTDISRLSALSELNINLKTFNVDNLKHFLWDWECGKIGPRFVRMTINFDDQFIFRTPLNVAHFYSEISEDTTDLSAELRNIITGPNTKTFVFYRNWTLKRQENISNQRLRVASESSHGQEDAGLSASSLKIARHLDSYKGRRKELSTSSNFSSESSSSGVPGSSSDSGFSDGTHRGESGSGSSPSFSRSSPEKEIKNYHWIGGACAVLQIDEDNKQITWTAVRSENYASQLVRFNLQQRYA